MATSQVLARSAGPAAESQDERDTAVAVAAPPTGPAPDLAPDLAPDAAPDTAGRYSLLLTREPAHVAAAQRLRHRVFAGEQGARPAPDDAVALAAAAEGRDADAFDAHCDHLVVREDATGAIVGTYRMLTPEGARAAGGLYSDTEFDLAALDGLRDEIVEVGRSCVHPDHRHGVVLSLVWAGILRYMVLSGRRWAVGCASVALTPEGAMPGGVWSLVASTHLAPSARRVRPWREAPIAGHDPEAPGARRAARAGLPPLLRGYLRLGAEIGGVPALDPDFGVADLFVLLDHTAIDPRWRRYLAGEDG
ncbi:GNAT family N-acetyltransferase [Actinomycetospora lutea]|uniref:GNAT family N-acetyltransferase n=1 Tax=Actinomycetospora lutea TaxID=663604 RepID=UPI002366D2F2|nr:GNAT family N-acyltransferase [Actinomycetospora lutea]MDD7942555.1 GNAT family N-acetyltransferase [Actinomycetospora lutea]